jgi:hypothetical protein
MELPSTVRYLLEALRGGNMGSQPNPAAQNPMAPKPAAVMPTKMRGYQLANQERAIEGLPPLSYAEYMKSTE